MNVRAELGPIGDALNAEFFKVRRRRMTYILLAVQCLLVLTFYLILFMQIREGPNLRRNGFNTWLALRASMSTLNVVPYGLALERFFATLVSVIFVGTMMGNEFDWRTVGVVTSRGVRRWHFIFAKVVIDICFMAIVVVLGFIVAVLCSLWFSHLYSLPYGTWGAARWWDIISSLLRTAVVVLPFVFMALAFATVWRSAGQAVGAALGFYFIEGIFTGLLNQVQEGFLSHVPSALLNINGDALMRANGMLPNGGGGPFSFGGGGVPIWRASTILLAYMAFFVTLVFWRFQKRDIQE
jgi:ABC-type transport system involved in multi-copper enzyme maturation permease subunit